MSRWLAVLGLLAGATLHAELSLAPVFTDNLVLQREASVPIWGAADPGAQVTATFAGHSKSAVADANGRWLLKLDPTPASAEPRTLSVIAQLNRQAAPIARQFTNVLVGEVWLAAGQSNMEWPLGKEAHAGEELPAATNRLLRLLNLPFAGQYFFNKPFSAAEVGRLTSDKFFTGTWQACSPGAARDFSAIGYYFGKEVAQETGVPVGLIHCAVGGSPTEAWIRRETLARDESLEGIALGNWLANTNLDDWCRQRGHENLDTALAAGWRVPGDDLGPNHPFKPAFLWDAGPAQLLPFAIRGVIWYQGESNSLEARRVAQHEQLFPLLVRDWRAQWGCGDFPFLYCQLSSLSTNGGYKASCWPEFRDQQRRFLDQLPNVGMAVTSDLGHPTDVHPRNKRDVGHRLALWALAKTYGRNIAFSGPLPKSVRRDGQKLIVQFAHADGGLRTADGKAPRGFEMAGSDGGFRPASAKLAGSEVFLGNADIPEPVTARYGWQPFTDANLENAAGLPASTFRVSLETRPQADRP